MKKISKKNERLYNRLTWIGLVVFILIVFGLKSGNLGSKECPEKIQGSEDPVVIIKYFKSPFCTVCWFQKPIINKLLDDVGHSFSLETYDVRYCSEEVVKNRILGTPTFVLSTAKGNGNEYVLPGYQEYTRLESFICGVSVKC